MGIFPEWNLPFGFEPQISRNLAMKTRNIHGPEPRIVSGLKKFFFMPIPS